jgi:MFS family permease
LLKDLELDLHDYGRIVAISTVAGAVAAAIAGRLTDKIGRVKLWCR